MSSPTFFGLVLVKGVFKTTRKVLCVLNFFPSMYLFSKYYNSKYVIHMHVY